MFRLEAATFLTVPSRTASLNPPSPSSSPSRNFTIYFISGIDRLPTRARRYIPPFFSSSFCSAILEFYSSSFLLAIFLPLRPLSPLPIFRFSHIEYYRLMVQKEQEPPGFGTPASTAMQGYRGAPFLGLSFDHRYLLIIISIGKLAWCIFQVSIVIFRETVGCPCSRRGSVFVGDGKTTQPRGCARTKDESFSQLLPRLEPRIETDVTVIFDCRHEKMHLTVIHFHLFYG